MRIVTVLLIALLLLTGCGFHLRGQGDIDESFRAVTVQQTGLSVSGSTWYAGGRDDMRRAVSEAFSGGGFVVREESPVSVDLVEESILRRIAGISADATAAGYEITLGLRFRITAADGSTIVPEKNLTATRSYNYQANAVMGSAEEEAMLYQEMRRDIAAQIVRFYRHNATRRSAALHGAPPAPANAPAP